MSFKKAKLVMVFGTFDYLHAGHENLFIQAKELGNEIIAIIARDKTVKTIKGNLPDHNEKERLKNLKETEWANKVILGNQKDKSNMKIHLKSNQIQLSWIHCGPCLALLGALGPF